MRYTKISLLSGSQSSGQFTLPSTIYFYTHDKIHIIINILCLPLCSKISRMEGHIVAFLSPVSRASPGKQHKLLVEFLTRTQGGEHSVCLSGQSQHATHETMPICDWVSLAQRASPGELHKLLDEFLTRMQSGQCSVLFGSFNARCMKPRPLTDEVSLFQHFYIGMCSHVFTWVYMYMCNYIYNDVYF